MLGKALLIVVLLIPLGIILGMMPSIIAQNVGMYLFWLGGAILGFLVLLFLALLAESVIFHARDRWTRFN